MLEPRDEVVFTKFTQVTGIPLPAEIEKFLPEGGLFTKGWRVFLGIAVIIGLGFYVRWKAQQEAESAEQEEYYAWRESRGRGN